MEKKKCITVSPQIVESRSDLPQSPVFCLSFFCCEPTQCTIVIGLFDQRPEGGTFDSWQHLIHCESKKYGLVNKRLLWSAVKQSGEPTNPPTPKILHPKGRTDDKGDKKTHVRAVGVN